jgi:DNA-binding transcriptional ArsR family regulator
MVDPRVLRAIGHPVRAELLRALEARDQATPMELVRELGGTTGSVMHHVSKLAALGVIELVEVRRRGRADEHVYRVRASGWGEILDRLERLTPPNHK